MISKNRAEQLYVEMHKHMTSNITTEDLDALTVVLTSEVVLKAFGRSLLWCQGISNEILALNMADVSAPVEFSRGQGQIEGVNTLIHGILNLITEEEEEEEKDE